MAMKINKKTLTADICLICAVLVAACLLLLIPKQEGTMAELFLDGKSVGKYSLDTDTEIELKDNNGKYISTFCIDDGKAFVKNASCHGGDCVKQGKIYKEGQCIVCLPNGLTVIIRGNGGIDGVTG